MLRRLALRDVVIVAELELDFDAGFSVLTGETGAGKSILVDALQLALGARAESSLVREGSVRAEVSAEFDTPPALAEWLAEAGFAEDGGGAPLLLRRSVDAQGRSRAWINGSAATVSQLRAAADHLLDIHGQHAWQSLTRPSAVRALLDEQAGIDGSALAAAWQAWRLGLDARAAARARRDATLQERERLIWQIGEVDKLAPGETEWETLNAEHQRLAHRQALIDATQAALDALTESDRAAGALTGRAIEALDAVVRFDATLAPVLDVLRSAQAQLEDAAHTLASQLGRSEPDADRLATLDARLGAWVALARRYKRGAAELPALLAGWKSELKALDDAADLATLEARVEATAAAWRSEAGRISALRRKAAPRLAAAVTAAMQQLGMDGGRFEVVLVEQDSAQAFGLESVEFRVAGHQGSTPRPLAKVASGGELSRLALAIAVTTRRRGSASASVPTLIFDEIDAGIGGSVADSVGRLMKQLGGTSQVLAVTHLAQVAACADHHFVVSKSLQGKRMLSAVQAVSGEARASEIARMLGGERLATATSRAHALAMLSGDQAAPR